jgi:hypothetical protein
MFSFSQHQPHQKNSGFWSLPFVIVENITLPLSIQRVTVTMIMRKVVALLLLFCLLREGCAFIPTILRTVSSRSRTTIWHSDPSSVDASEAGSSLLPSFLESHDYNDVDDNFFPSSSPLLLPRKPGIRGFFYNRFAGFVTGLVGFVTEGIATDDYEYAELPPP